MSHAGEIRGLGLSLGLGKGKEAEQSNFTAESTSSPGDKPAAQSTFWAGLSAEQAESLTTLVSDAISNTIEPMNGHLNKEIASLTTKVANLQTIMERMISFQHSNREKPTAQASPLSGFSVGKAKDPAIPNNRKSSYVATESASSYGEHSYSHDLF